MDINANDGAPWTCPWCHGAGPLYPVHTWYPSMTIVISGALTSLR